MSASKHPGGAYLVVSPKPTSLCPSPSAQRLQDLNYKKVRQVVESRGTGL